MPIYANNKLHDRQMVNGLRKNAWASTFRLYVYAIYVHVMHTHAVHCMFYVQINRYIPFVTVGKKKRFNCGMPTQL